MLLLILGLLAFVILHSMRTRQAVQQEEEVSVENMLQSTPEAEPKILMWNLSLRHVR